jgi:amino acid adenylation domain-containing protein
MIPIEDYLNGLVARGAKFRVEDGRIRFRAPQGVVTPEVAATLKAREAEVIALLAPAGDASIPRLPEAASYELSHSQKRLWILHQMDPASAAYNVPVHQLLEGPLDRAAVDRAISGLVERHESLRTVFTVVDGEPRQVVNTYVKTPVAFLDLSSESSRDLREEKGRTRAREHAVEPFDLECCPLFRAELVRLEPERHLLLITMHHIISDGVSIAVIARDFAQLYSAALSGTDSSSLPALRIHYRDYAAYQNLSLESPRTAPHREYWTRKLSGATEVLNLPADFPRPAVQTFKGRELTFAIDAATTRALRDLGNQNGASLFMTLVAAVKTLLHRYTGQEDIIVGSPAAGRVHADLEDQVGFYLNTLALRDTVTGEMTFEGLLAAVRATATEAYEHQIYPFDRLVEDLKVERDLSRAPLFDVMVLLQVNDTSDFTFENLRVSSVFEHTGTSKLDLSFNFKELGDGLLLGIEFNTDLFLEERIATMGRHLLRVIGEVLAHPAEPIARLALLSPEERYQVLYGFNDTEVEYPRDRALIDFFEEQVARTPDAPAVHHIDRTLTYRELEELANRTAHHLTTACGFRAGEIATLAAPSGFEMLASLLAVMKLRGGVFFMDPAFPIARQEFLLADSGSRVLITADRPEGLSFSDSILEWERDRAAIAAAPCARPDVSGRRPDDTVLVFYTSGSTGKPKGVPLTNRGLVNEMHWYRDYFHFTARDVIPQKTIVTFEDCIVELLLPITFADGGCVYLRPHYGITKDFPALFAWFKSVGATMLQFVPTIFEQLEAEVNFRDLTTMRALVLSGGIVTRRFDYPFRVYNLYGNSECTALSTWYDMTGPSPLRRVPVGKPLQNTTIYILDASGEPCPIFVPGEMYVGGDMVSHTYLNNEALAATKFLESPFKEGETIFRTGDYAQWYPDGNIDFLGRLDDQVKIRGFRIECGEIENTLLQHPAVREVVVVGKRLDRQAQELVAYIVGSEGTVGRGDPAPTSAPVVVGDSAPTSAPVRMEIPANDLRAFLAKSLPDYMIPSFFVFLEAFPRTPSGKIDKKALPLPSATGAESASGFVGPRDDVEEAIARVWQKVLEIPSVGIHDDFLDLGGHSLKATKVVSRIRKEHGYDLHLVDIFRSPTVAGLAELARSRGIFPPGAASREDEIRPVEAFVEPPSADELAFLNEGDQP